MSSISEMTSAPGSEGARRATVDAGARGLAGAPDPEVTEQAKRRRFTAEYKLRILREADACKRDGAQARSEGQGRGSSSQATRARERSFEASPRAC